MTKEEALTNLNKYKDQVNGLFTLFAMTSLEFGLANKDMEKVLGLEPNQLWGPLTKVAVLDAASAYLAVLENAAKGQLSGGGPVSESVAAKKDDYGFGEGEVIIDG